MLIRLILLPYTFFSFLIGYTSIFIIMLIRGLSILNSLWIAFIGGLIFIGIWIFILKIFSILLSEKELVFFFNIDNFSENLSKSEHHYSDEDDPNPLTMDELYSQNKTNETDQETSNNISYQNENNTHEQFEPSEDLIHSDNMTKSHLNPDGTFDLSVNGKTVKSTPQDGAKAITKVLVDDDTKKSN